MFSKVKVSLEVNVGLLLSRSSGNGESRPWLVEGRPRCDWLLGPRWDWLTRSACDWLTTSPGWPGMTKHDCRGEIRHPTHTHTHTLATPPPSYWLLTSCFLYSTLSSNSRFLSYVLFFFSFTLASVFCFATHVSLVLSHVMSYFCSEYFPCFIYLSLISSYMRCLSNDFVTSFVFVP